MDFTVQLFIFSSYRTHITASSNVNIASLIRPRSDHSIAFALVKVTLRHWILWQLSDITLTCEDGRVAADSLWGCRLYCCCWNKTKSMLLILEQNKINVVGAGKEQKPCCGWRNRTKARLIQIAKNCFIYLAICRGTFSIIFERGHMILKLANWLQVLDKV